MIRELLGQVDRYLTGVLTARGLESWLVTNLDAILDSGDQKAIDAANKIDATLIRLSDGELTEWDLRRDLQLLASLSRTVFVVSDFRVRKQRSWSTNTTGSSTELACVEEKHTRDYFLQAVAG